MIASVAASSRTRRLSGGRTRARPRSRATHLRRTTGGRVDKLLSPVASAYYGIQNRVDILDPLDPLDPLETEVRP